MVKKDLTTKKRATVESKETEHTAPEWVAKFLNELSDEARIYIKSVCDRNNVGIRDFVIGALKHYIVQEVRNWFDVSKEPEPTYTLHTAPDWEDEFLDDIPEGASTLIGIFCENRDVGVGDLVFGALIRYIEEDMRTIIESLRVELNH